MTSITCFVEGNEDVRFMTDLVDHLKIKSSFEFKTLGGWTNLPSGANEFKRSLYEGKKNLIIFDADSNLEDRRSQIDDNMAKAGIVAELFLLPDNQSPGSLDTLLLKIAHEDHIESFECFDAYYNCLRLCVKKYALPSIKNKIYSFIQINSEKAKIEERDFLKNQLWNLDHPQLEALKRFLIDHSADADG